MELKSIEEINEKLHYAKKIVAISPEESIEISISVYEIAVSEGLKLLEGYALLNIALYNRIKSDISSMLENTYKALEIFKAEKDMAGKIKSYNLIGVAYF